MMLMFRRKVLRADESVVCTIDGYSDGEQFAAGVVKFPTKQTWTKFWGAVQRGAMYVPDLEVHMENVPDESNIAQPPNPNEGGETREGEREPSGETK